MLALLEEVKARTPVENEFLGTRERLFLFVAPEPHGNHRDEFGDASEPLVGIRGSFDAILRLSPLAS